MYSTCLHCHASLGSNQSIEAFPVGKRLAFDAAKGRLWVVCPACGRWNLTPLEERWEAVEDCERQFREARQRVSQGEIGLAHLRSGVRLVRIGAPPATEMAAWRYGKVLRQRWWTRGLPMAVVGVGGSSLQFVNAYSPEAWAPAVVISSAFLALGLVHAFRVRGRLVLPDGRVAKLRLTFSGSVELSPAADGGWLLNYSQSGHESRLAGLDATHTLRGLLTIANYTGARDAAISSALDLLDRAHGPREYIDRLVRASQGSGIRNLREYPADVRCALEMALHDDAERRAMEGELDDLRAEWERAEEIAAIADGMFFEPASASRTADVPGVTV